MDQPEDKKVTAELDCQTSCSSDSENASDTESQSSNPISRRNWSKALNCDANQYETPEELDFEDEKRNTSRNCAELKSTSKELNVTTRLTKSMEKVIKSNVNVPDMKTVETRSENAGMNEKRFNLGEMKEGEAIDDEDSADMEDGEIEEKSKSDYTLRDACRFYQRGRCAWGNKCNYLHLSDKGLYNMLDLPVIPKCTFLQTAFVNKENFFRPIPREPARRFESIWDRALIEAKERIKQSRVKRNESFEEKLYMTVGNDDGFVDEWESSHDRHVLPVPKRQICDFSSRYDYNKPKKLNMNEAVKPKIVRKTYGSTTDCISGWRDPWRRSKTPPRRKRCLSKPLSNSSKSSSSDNSQSSWTSRSCQSPTPKRSRHRSRTSHSKHSHSSSYKCSLHRPSPATSLLQSSSCSCSASTFSCTDSSSVELCSTRVNCSRKKCRLQSRSPVYRKRKGHTPERIVLPHKRQSRSIPRSVTPIKRRSHSVSRNTKVLQQDKSVTREQPRGMSRRITPVKRRSHSVSRNTKVLQQDKSVIREQPRGISRRITPIKRRSHSVSHKSKVFQQDKSVTREQPRGISRNSHSCNSRLRSLSSSSKSSTKLKPSVARSFEVKSVLREHGTSNKSHTYSSRSRSLSSSSKSSTNLEHSAAGSSRSGSISISPVSNASLNRKRKRSDKELQRKSFLHDLGSSKKHINVHRRSSDILRSDVGVLSHGRPKNPNKRTTDQNNAPPVSDTKAQSKASKRINSLELELLKYVGNFRPVSKHPPSLSKPSHLENSGSVKGTASVSISNKGKVDIRSKLTKRDLLMEQLKAVEEAIAKKRKLDLVRD